MLLRKTSDRANYARKHAEEARLHECVAPEYVANTAVSGFGWRREEGWGFGQNA